MADNENVAQTAAQSEAENDAQDKAKNTTSDSESEQTPKNDDAKNAEPQSKSEKTIAKLQERISKLASAKNDKQGKLDKALEEIEKLKNQSNSDSKPAPDVKQQISERDNEIKALKAKLSRVNAKNEARDIFAKAGQNVDSGILDMVVSDDKAQMYKNIQSVLGYANNIAKTTKTQYYTDSTPRMNGTKEALTKEQISNIKDPAARIKAIKENINLFK